MEKERISGSPQKVNKKKEKWRARKVRKTPNWFAVWSLLLNWLDSFHQFLREFVWNLIYPMSVLCMFLCICNQFVSSLTLNPRLASTHVFQIRFVSCHALKSSSIKYLAILPNLAQMGKFFCFSTLSRRSTLLSMVTEVLSNLKSSV